MNEKPLISIIMPAYNSEKFIEQAIESVINQTYENWELIVINDASVDETKEIVLKIAEHESRIRYFDTPQNLGVSKTRNKAVSFAKGEWIAFLDSDDRWKVQKLEKQIHLQKELNAELLFTGSAFMDVNGQPLEWVLHVPNEIRYKKLLKQNVISNSSVLVKKELYQKYEVVGDDMHEDFACWLNILKSGKKAYGIDESLLVYRLSANSKSGNKIKAAKMNWNTYKKNWVEFRRKSFLYVLLYGKWDFEI